MTTIAYRNGLMAADSSFWDGSVSVNMHDVRKMYRIGGGIVGCAGSVDDEAKFLAWLRDGADEDEYPRMKDLEAIVVDPNGVVHTFDNSSATGFLVKSPYVAIGMGALAALGCMFGGADAVTAVRAAVKHASGTTLPIRRMQLKRVKAKAKDLNELR